MRRTAALRRIAPEVHRLHREPAGRGGFAEGRHHRVLIPDLPARLQRVAHLRADRIGSYQIESRRIGSYQAG